MVGFCESFIEVLSLLRWTLDFAAVDVVDDIMGRTSIDGASHRLSGSQNLFDGSCRENIYI